LAKNLFDLTGKVALITGGNSGLGFGFATALAMAGADVVIWGRRADRNAAAVEQLRAHGGGASSRVVDVSVESEVVDGIAAAVEEKGRIDVLFINAGIATVTPLIQMTSRTYHELIDVNQHGVFYTLREGAKHMVSRSEAGDRGGSIVLCGSLAIFRGVPGMAHYNAAKGAVNTLGKNAAVELGRYGIRCNTVAPGLIKTDIGNNVDDAASRMAAERSIRNTPLGRVGEPMDLAGIAVYLASDLSRFHTGDTITIDGGRMASGL
jgi:NAD(P)-dependent dehydrogenase (short-subunit alcohol dehydrogenase family)